MKILEFLNSSFDVSFLIIVLFLYIYLCIFKESRMMFAFLCFCLFWSTSAIWTLFIPNHEYLFNDNSRFHGYMLTLGGLIYGIPLAMLSFISWFIKEKREKKNREVVNMCNKGKIVILVLVVASLAYSTLLFAQSSDQHWQNSKGENVENETNIKSKNNFGAQLLLTDDKDYMKKWEQPADGFYVHAVHTAIRKQPIFTLITFVNPGVDENGVCNISADVVVKTPDGKVYGEEIKEGDCWQNMPAPPAGNIQLSKFSMGIVIEEIDPPGRYTVNVVVKDKVKNTELQLSDYFDVI